MKKKSNSKLRGLGYYLIILMFLIILVTSLLQSQPQTAVTYSQVVDAFENEQVVSFTIKDNELEATLKDDSVLNYTLADGEIF